VVTPWAFGHFLLRSQGIFALPVGKDSTQRSVQFSGAGSIIIQSGAGKVTLGNQVQEAHAGTVVFIPRNTWISMDNVGKDKLTHTDVFSSPGYEQYLRSISVPEGQPIVPLSKSEIDALREKYSAYGVYRQ